MHYFIKSLRISGLAIAIFTFNVSTALTQNTPAKKQENKLAIEIADNYLRSFSSDATEEEPTKTKKKIDRNVKPPILDDFTKRKVIFHQLFSQSNNFSTVQKSNQHILNEYAWDDLKLFYGTVSDPGYHLIATLNKNITTVGESVLATLLATPTSHIKTLQQRQRIIQTIRDNPSQHKALQGYLRNYKAAEQSILSLWTKRDPLYSQNYTEYINKKFYFRTRDELSNINRSASALELRKRIKRDLFGILLPIVYPLFFFTIKDKVARDVMLPFKNIHCFSKEGLLSEAAVWLAISNGLYLFSVAGGISSYIDYHSALRYMALRLADIQTFLLATAEISACVAASPALEKTYGPHLAAMRELLDQANTNTEFGNLIYRLQHIPLKNWSYLFNNAGKLLASYKVFLAYKDEFVDAFYDLGQLDTFTAIAQLMQEAQAYSDNAYAFTQFLDRKAKPKPYVKLTDMWNPFVDAQKAVPNSITMDGQGGMRTMILTGPNAGGKSTFLTGVTSSVLLSQVFGIAPAKEMIMTPFNKINTYINVADDIAAGKSLFMAEVDRAQKHIKILEGLHANELSFSIMDELFSGTNPKEGEAAAYSIMEYMGTYKNTLNIIATHFPRVMLLEKNAQDKGFMNYKVFITHEGHYKKLNYTYKVVPGKSNQAIALDILEEQGYNTKMLERARDIIAHPEKYPADF